MSLVDFAGVKEQSFEPIPVGEYLVTPDDVSVKPTKAGTGEYISMKLRIMSGNQEGRFLFHTFNIKNESTKAVEIGLGQLKTYMRCAGLQIDKLEKVTDLVGDPVVAVVKHKQDDYGTKAVVSYFKPAESEPKEPTKKVDRKGSSPF